MSAHSVAPGAQQKRFAAFLNRLAQAAGHLDRVVPLKSYCTGLLLPGERKSVEPMAARLCPDKVRQTHQSLHHVVAHAPWRDENILEAVRQYPDGKTEDINAKAGDILPHEAFEHLPENASDKPFEAILVELKR